VTATNASGVSAASAASAAAIPATIPDVPVGVSAVTSTNRQSLVTWTLPSDGGSAITMYRVNATLVSSPSTSVSFSDTSLAVDGSGAQRHVNQWTAAGTVTYTFAVPDGTSSFALSYAAGAGASIRSVLIDGTPWISAKQFDGTTNWTTIRAAELGSISLSAGVHRLTVSSDSTRVALDLYGLVVTTTDGPVACTSLTTSCTVTGLINGASYTFKVIATNFNGSSAASAASTAITPATVPGVPTSVQATLGTDGQPVISWVASLDTGGDPVSSYTVSGFSGSRSLGAVTCVQITTTSCRATGLSSGVSYSFSITATNRAGTSSASAQSDPILPVTSPGVVTSVAATSNSDATSRVTWVAPADTGGSAISSYEVVATPGNIRCLSGNADRYCDVSGLTNGVTYTFVVYASNSLLKSAASSSATATPTGLPSAPLTVQATSMENGQSTVTWLAPTSDGSRSITGYTVTAFPGKATCSPSAASALSCVVSGLVNGGSYTFSVVASNANGAGATSVPSAVAIPATRATAPTGVRTTFGNREVTVSWTAPTTDGGTAIIRYIVTSTPSSLTCTTLATTCIVTGLRNGTTYTFTVQAENRIGLSESSVASAEVIPAQVPGEPTSVAVTVADASATIRWGAPTITGGSASTGYVVYQDGNAVSCVSERANSCVVSGLRNGTSYLFSVAVTNKAGTGVAAAAAAPAVPFTLPNAPQISNVAGGDMSVTVNWTSMGTGGSPITGYSVQAYVSGTADTGKTCTTTGATSCIVSSLTNGVTYTFKVTATNARGKSAESLASGESIPAGRPPAPTGVVATSNVSSSSVVSWTASSNTNGPLIGFVVTASPGGVTCSAGPADRSCTVTGLTNGTSYSFTVRMKNPWGFSLESNTASATPSTVPGAARIMGVVVADAKATVTFAAPTSNGGAAITGYTVTSTPGGKTCTTTLLSCDVSGLTNGTAYTFTVTATNASGSGSASSASVAVTPAGPPSAPTGVTASEGNASATVSWTAPTSTGGAAISYIVTSSSGRTCATSGLTCTLSGLANGTGVTFTVRAVNWAGGNDSVASGTVTPSTVPDQPNAPTVEVGDGKLTVKWEKPDGGGRAISSYTLTVCTGTTCSDIAAGDNSARSILLSDLTLGSDYVFKIRASNLNGAGLSSLGSLPVTVQTFKPAAPTITSVVPGRRSATITWTAGATTGATAKTYTVTAGSLSCTTTSLSCTITGMTPDTEYSFTVAGTSGTQQSDSSAAVNATPQADPGKVGDVALTIADTKITVTWTAPTANDGRTISGYTVVASTGTECTAAVTPRTCEFSDLSNGTQYSFVVYTKYSGGSMGVGSEPVYGVPSKVPSAPLIVFGSPTATTISLRWVAGASDAPITKYEVVDSTDTYKCESTTTFCTVAGIPTNSDLLFKIRATNGAGTGAWSSNWTAPRAEKFLCLTPQNISVVPTSGGFTASWTFHHGTVTDENQDTRGDGYRCDKGDSVYPDDREVVVKVTPVDSTGKADSTKTQQWTIKKGSTADATITKSGLVAGAYAISISETPMMKKLFQYRQWRPAFVLLNMTIGVAPDVPTGVSTTVKGGSSNNRAVQVSWTRPAAGAEVQRYIVTSSPGGYSCTTASTTCVVSGLSGNTSYTFSVVTVNSWGSSAAVASTAVNSGAPGDPVAPNNPGNVTVGTPGADGSVTLTWTAPSGSTAKDAISYVVESDPFGLACATAALTCTISGLRANTSYFFKVKSVQGALASAGASSTTVTWVVAPDAPAITSLVPADGKVTVTVQAPAKTYDSTITGYTVTASTSSSSLQGSRTCSATTVAKSCEITGLTNGVVYWFTAVATVSATVSSAASVAKSQTPAGAPGTPTAVTATSGNAQISVSWTAATDNGSAIRFYTASAKDASGNTKSCVPASVSQTSCAITGLTNGVAYTVSVIATNAVKSGSAGSATERVTPATAPAMPIISSAVAGAGSVQLTWTAPATGGSAIIGYTVTPYVGANARTSFECVLVNPCTVTGLTSGTAYTFTVKAKNAVGTGSESVASNSVIPVLAPPDAPVITQIAVKSQTEVLVAWTAPSANGGAISGYTVTAVGGSSSITPCTTTSALTCTISGLTTGTSYTFSVTATNAAGTGSAGTMTSTAGLEFAPEYANGVRFVAKTLQFDSVLGFATGITMMTIQITGTTSASIPVFIRMKSMSDWSVSLIPSQVSTPITPVAGLTTPAPTGVSAISGKNFVALSWIASAGSSASQKYLVKDYDNWYFCLTSTTSCIISGLDSVTNYSFTVTPVVEPSGSEVSYRKGAASTSVSVTTSSESWTIPVGSIGIFKPVSMVHTSVDSSYVFQGTIALDTSGAQILTAEYIWWGPSTTAGGSWSLTSVAVPDKPTGLHITSNSTTQVTARWNAAADNGARITSYVVTASPGGKSCTTLATSNTAAPTTCVVTGLVAGTTYTFTVVAVNSQGASVSSAITTPVTPQFLAQPPVVPVPVNPVAVGGVGSALVSWSAPANNYGASVKRYEVRSVSATGASGTLTDSVTHPCNTTGLSCTVTGLVDGVRYWFDVRVVVGDAATTAGEFSSGDVRSNWVTSGFMSMPDPQVPSAPSGVTVASVPANPDGIATPNAIIRWTAAADNGSTITSYRVEGFKRATPAASTPTVPGAIEAMNTRLLCETVTLSCTIPNLAVGAYYTFTVSAINRVGATASAHSSMIKAGVASGVASPATNLVSFFGGAPVAVRGSITCCTEMEATGVSATAVSNGSSQVSWTALTGGALSEYTVTSSPGGRGCSSATTFSSTSCIVTGLTNGTSYTFKVTARQITGTLVTDSFSATVGSVELSNIVMTWRSKPIGTFAAGWSGTADFEVGFGIKVKTTVTSYTGPLDWTLTALQTDSVLGDVEMIPGVKWPAISLVGTVASVNGSISWSLESKLKDLDISFGRLQSQGTLDFTMFSITNMTISLRNVCPTLTGTKAYVCPRGMNTLYLVATISVVLRLPNPAATSNDLPYTEYSTDGYLVFGLMSNTLTIAVKFPDGVVASGVTLKGPLLQMYTTTAPPVSLSSIPLIGVPGAPWSVSATSVLSDGTATVRWIAPPNDGGTMVLGYTVVATPSAKSSDTSEHPVVTCTVGQGSYTVTREAVKTAADPQKAPKSTSVRSSSTSLNTFCAMQDLDPGTEYTYTVTAFNAVGQGAPAVSTAVGSVSILGALKGARFFVELSGGLNLADLGIDISVKMTLVPLGADGKAMTAENPCKSAETARTAICKNMKYGWAVIANIASDAGAKKSMLGIDGVSTMAYTTMPATVVLNGIEKEITENTFMFGVTMTLTDSMRKVLPGVDKLNGVLTFKPSTREWSVTVSLATGWQTKIGAVSLDFLSTTVSVAGVGLIAKALELNQVGSISFANKDGSSTSIRATLGLRIQTSGSVSVGITVTGNYGEPVWANMFGYKGFDLMTMSMSVGIGGVLPELGLAGTVRLPADMISALGGKAAVKMTVAVNLSQTNPCAAFDVEAVDGVSNVVDIANGSLTAKKVMIVVAPFGCTIGAGVSAVVYPEGASVSFAGSFMKLTVAARFSIIWVGTTLTISGAISVGAITMGELKLDASTIEVTLSTGFASLQYFKFSGGATLLGTKSSVLAEASYYLGTPFGSVSATVSIANMTIGGFGLKDVYVRFDLSSTNPLNFSLDFGAKIPILPGVMLSAAGKISLTQIYVLVDSTINWGSFSVVAKGTVYLGNSNGSTTFSASVTLGLSILDQNLSASLVIATDEKGAHYSAEYSLNFAPFGRVKLTFYSDCVWAGFPNGAITGARIEGRFTFGVLSGSFTGSATLGSNASGKPTLLVDFTVTATLGISWAANVSATVRFYNCNATCKSYVTPVLQLKASTTWMGKTVDTGWQSISLDGTFSISSSSSFSRTSGTVYGCDTSDRGSNCDSDPKSAGLLRWQASFSGSASFTFTQSGFSVSTSAKAQIDESASKSSCTKWGGAKGAEICLEYDYSWGSFVKKVDVDISIDTSSAALKALWGDRTFSA